MSANRFLMLCSIALGLMQGSFAMAQRRFERYEIAFPPRSFTVGFSVGLRRPRTPPLGAKNRVVLLHVRINDLKGKPLDFIKWNRMSISTGPVVTLHVYIDDANFKDPFYIEGLLCINGIWKPMHAYVTYVPEIGRWRVTRRAPDSSSKKNGG